MENRVFSPFYVNVNQIILTLDPFFFFLTLGNSDSTLENLGPRVNEPWDSGPRENPEKDGGSCMKLAALEFTSNKVQNSDGHQDNFSSIINTEDTCAPSPLLTSNFVLVVQGMPH